jgi:hypothetical protein
VRLGIAALALLTLVSGLVVLVIIVSGFDRDAAFALGITVVCLCGVGLLFFGGM